LHAGGAHTSDAGVTEEIVRIARVLATPVFFVGLALGTAPPGAAAEPMQGVYTYAQAGMPPLTWTIVPTCVRAGCVLHVTSPEYAGDARPVSDLWTLVTTSLNGLKCPDGTAAPTMDTYTFDDATLAGTHTFTHDAVCGLQPDMTKEPFTLAFQSPLAMPVQLDPFSCDEPSPPFDPSPPFGPCAREDY
jgi:hypothetical protein